ncbi:Hypothetical protein FKW44_003056 [Caligus rogercresseyi]|uniref:Uncharacterized protein n=1 Tax=Caligus rogercresseyi TaxID=217165 RepID=A0A7T8QWN8_CALRO|nr:Hypothetical protein FKW44_003056 [Caligus rogercresseyi]
MLAPRNVIVDAFNAGLSISEPLTSLKAIYGNKPSLRRSFRRSSKTSGIAEMGWTREAESEAQLQVLRKTSMKSKAYLTMKTE